MQRALRALCALGALAAALSSEAASAPLAASIFAYDAKPPQITVMKTLGAGSSLVSFQGAKGAITAELIRPASLRPGSAPGVLFVHWLGDKRSDHQEFESDARVLATHGIVSLLIDAPWAQKNWFMSGRTTANDYANSVSFVTDLRRSLDTLSASGADPQRMAYVGHDFGAMYGAVLSGVDPRPKYYVLMAGTSSFASWFLLGPKPADVDTYRRQISVLDPSQYLPDSHAAAFLLQFASKDEYIDADHARQFYDAAPMPKLVGFYDTDHSLDVPQAHEDRIRWLIAHLTAH
ncbi:MAG: hypothetical protein JO165_02705 [Candidatus Eremiobacteraeota bacterium]|nr:hypothetical protein [Candidatus Eremiobacteraeota bacterium]